MYPEQEPEHLVQLRNTLRRFVADHMPVELVRQWDRDHTFPPSLFQRLAELGVCGLTIDEDYGGQGRDIVAAVVVIEELTRRGGFAAGPFIHAAFYGGVNISENGSEQQKRDLLPKIAAGQLLFAYGLSEPNVGGDLASVSTTADLVDDGKTVRINGTKRWCTGADFADYIYCLVRSDREAPRHQNLSFVLIPTKNAGITTEALDHVNLRYTLSSDVIFDDVEIPAELIVGGAERWNRGWQMLAGEALNVEKIEISAVAYGVAKAAVEDAWRYAEEREQFGRAISGHQAVRHALVDARTKLQACRHMLYHAASLVNERKPASVETSMAKLFIAETAVEIGLICQRTLGAYGLSADYEMERHVRDLLGMPIVGGSSNMQRNNIATLLGLKAK